MTLLDGASAAAGAAARSLGVSAGPSDSSLPLDRIAALALPAGAVVQTVQPIAARALQQVQAGAGTSWGGSLQSVLGDAAQTLSFGKGVAEGVFDGAKALVGGAIDLVEGVGKAAYDSSPLGFAVAGVRDLGVIDHVPGFLPDADRLAAKVEGATDAVTDYVGAVAHDPARLGNDIKGAIANGWTALETSHAAATARGGAAEAEWWGHAVGRAAFEVAATVVPATKFATVARAGEALEAGVRTGKLAETFAEAARAGRLAELFGAAMKTGRLPALIGEARATGRLPELAQVARQTSGGIEAIAGRGGLTAGEINALRTLGTLSVGEAKLARVAELVARRGDDIRIAAQETGIAQPQIADILATLKPDRPLPETYLSHGAIGNGIAKFDEGAVRFLAREDYNRYGTLGPPKGGFVMPYREFADMVKAAGRDYAKVEQRLGLSPGTLTGGDTMIVKIERDQLDGLRLPSGNEGGANEKWLPGGRTSGGVSEAVMDFSTATSGQEIRLK